MVMTAKTHFSHLNICATATNFWLHNNYDYRPIPLIKKVHHPSLIFIRDATDIPHKQIYKLKNEVGI